MVLITGAHWNTYRTACLLSIESEAFPGIDIFLMSQIILMCSQGWGSLALGGLRFLSGGPGCTEPVSGCQLAPALRWSGLWSRDTGMPGPSARFVPLWLLLLWPLFSTWRNCSRFACIASDSCGCLGLDLAAWIPSLSLVAGPSSISRSLLWCLP